jgi:hypothetical protein
MVSTLDLALAPFTAKRKPEGHEGHEENALDRRCLAAPISSVSFVFFVPFVLSFHGWIKFAWAPR